MDEEAAQAATGPASYHRINLPVKDAHHFARCEAASVPNQRVSSASSSSLASLEGFRIA
jgi:hypothetical protein